jgi:hypothetical protein
VRLPSLNLEKVVPPDCNPNNSVKNGASIVRETRENKAERRFKIK